MSKFEKPKESKVSVRVEASRSPSLMDYIDRLSVRLLLVLIPISIVSLLCSFFVMPYLAPFYGNHVAREIKTELKGRIPSPPETLEIIHKYGLSWCFVTNLQGEKLNSTAAFSPPTLRIPLESKKIKIRGKFYYDAVTPIGQGFLLHAGFPNETSLSHLSFSSISSIVRPVPFGFLFVFMIALFVATFFVAESMAGLSAFLLGATIDKLATLVDKRFTPDDVRKSIELNWATSEIRATGSSLFVLMRKVSEAMEKKHEAEELEAKKKEKKRQQARLSATGTFEKPQILPNIQETGVFEIQVARVLKTSNSVYDYATKLLDSVNTIFSDIVEYAAFLKIESNGEISIEKELGFGAEGVDFLKRINHKEITDERTLSKKSIELGPMQIKRLGFEPLARQYAIGNIIYLPFHFEGKGVALLAVYVKQGIKVKPDRVRALEAFHDKASAIFTEVVEKEQSEDERLLDPVTGLGNMTYFQELIPMVLERTRSTGGIGTFTLAFVGMDFSSPDLVRFPAEMRQRWMKEVGHVLKQVLPVSKRLLSERGANTFLSRYHEDVIACVMEGTDASYAMTQIDGIQSVLESRTQWAGGIGKIPFSIAVASFPNDGGTAEELVRSVDRTLSYIQEMMGGTGVYTTSDVPPGYTPKESTEIAGTLGVLNAADLLQSISASENTGVLTVENELGQQFICICADGKPITATLGNFAGMNAVGEFVITFKTGQYNFHQRKLTNKELNTPSQLHSIEHCLMEAALYEDKMNAALKVIPNAGILVRSIEDVQAMQRLQAETDVTQEEITVVQSIGKLASKPAPLEAIFQRMDNVPSFVKWRAAALMVEHNLLEWQWPTMH